MKFISPVFAKASGSLGGTVYSHNKGGMYVRNRSTPINPATANQQAVRNALKTLTTRWSQTLTSVQRDAWKTYATNVPLINKLGESRVIPELAMYLRCNSPRLINNGASDIIDNAPTIFSLATFTAITMVKSGANLHVTFDNSDDWAIADGGYMFLYLSRPQNQSVNFWKGPYNQTGEILGNTMTPPTSPATVAPAYPLTVGRRYFYRVNVSNPDGRLSSSMTGYFDAV